MTIDHIFILCENEGQAADQLVEFGLKEGNGRVHIGQGTTNRKFHFRNFFLEILWVHDEQEIKSFLTRPMGLWKRTNFSDQETSRFGLCLTNTEETDPMFEESYKYQPDYFPEGFRIEILKNEEQPSLPWTFRLPIQFQNQTTDIELTDHKVSLKNLTKAIFEYNGQIKNDYLSHFNDDSQVLFKKSERSWLTLIFDQNDKGQTKDFEDLSITISY